MSDPQGLAYDAFAEDYERGRPGWPAAILDGIEATHVLDLAAGTGKLTRLLVERYEHVVAVEPLAGMRAVLSRTAPGADVREGTAEQIPVDDDAVDAVFVAEAFHWFDSERTVRELGRVLRPAGVVHVCFNHWRGQFEPPIGDAARTLLEEAYAKLPAPGGPKVDSGAWKRGFTTTFEESEIEHEWTTDRVGVASNYLSTSSLGAVPESERRQLRDRLVEELADVEYRLPMTARSFRTVLP